MKNFKHEQKRRAHKEAIKRAGGSVAYRESKLWGKKLKVKEKKNVI
jgi:hypothetical protein